MLLYILKYIIIKNNNMECPSCNKSFTSQKNLCYHISNNVCQKFNQKNCPLCGHVFSTIQMCKYHVTHNVCQKKSKPKIVLKLKGSCMDMSKDELIIKVAQLEGENKALKENPQHINSTNNFILFPTAYGKEDLAYIQQKLGDILEPLVKGRPSKCIPTLFNTIHNNKQLPEYHNVYTPSERSSYAMVSNGESFTHVPKKTIIDKIIEDKRSLLNDYVDKNERLGDKVLKKYEMYQDQLDSDNSEIRKTLELEIGGLLLDMKSVIAKDEKTRNLLDKVSEGDFVLPIGEDN